MGAKLQALIDLQDIELQIVDIRRQIARLERKVAAQRRRLQAAHESVEQQREQIRREQARFDALDMDIKGRSANIERLREHLNTVRTNKEYAAVLAQMNNEKADASRLESQALQLMAGVDEKRKALAETEEAVEGDVQRLEEAQAELEQTRESFAGRLERLEAQKGEAIAALERSAAELFERLSERYEGEALAEVQRPNPRLDEFVCSGCHMALRADVANALQIHDEVQTCKSCGRILILERT